MFETASNEHGIRRTTGLGTGSGYPYNEDHRITLTRPSTSKTHTELERLEAVKTANVLSDITLSPAYGALWHDNYQVGRWLHPEAMVHTFWSPQGHQTQFMRCV